MREAHRPNGLGPPSNCYLAGAAFEELYYGFRNMPNSFRQRLERDPEKGQAYLLATQAALPEDNPYFTKEEILSAKYLKSGFHAAVYKFESSTGEWVIKVGMKKSPERAPHPSSEEFTAWYSSVLDQEREIFKDSLPYLIPEPQTVLHIKTEDHESSTVILQPFIKGIIPLDRIRTLSVSDQEKLRDELKVAWIVDDPREITARLIDEVQVGRQPELNAEFTQDLQIGKVFPNLLQKER